MAADGPRQIVLFEKQPPNSGFGTGVCAEALELTSSMKQATTARANFLMVVSSLVGVTPVGVTPILAWVAHSCRSVGTGLDRYRHDVLGGVDWSTRRGLPRQLVQDRGREACEDRQAHEHLRRQARNLGERA